MLRTNRKALVMKKDAEQILLELAGVLADMSDQNLQLVGLYLKQELAWREQRDFWNQMLTDRSE